MSLLGFTRRRPVLAGTVFGALVALGLVLLLGGAPSDRGMVADRMPELGDGEADPTPVLSVPGGRSASALRPNLPDWPVHVRVEGEGQGALEGALLYFASAAATSLPLERATHRTTSKGGEASLPQPPESDDLLLVRAADFVPRSMTRDELLSQARASESPVVVKLRRGGVVHGVVLDAAGVPVSGARVYARSSRGNGVLADGPAYLPGRRSVGALCSGISGSDGTFEIRGIAAFPVSLLATGREIIQRDYGEPPVALSDGTHVEVRVCRAYFVDVKAIDRVTREPIQLVHWGAATAEGVVTVDGTQPYDSPTQQGGWREGAVYRQYFLALGDPRSPAAWPTMVADAPGYEKKMVQVKNLATRGAAVLVLELDALDRVSEWGRLTLQVSIDGARAAPATVTLNLAPIQDPATPPDTSFFSIKLPLGAGSEKGEEGWGQVTVRVPKGRYEAFLILWVGYALPALRAGEVTIRQDEQAHLAVRVPVPRIRVYVVDADGHEVRDCYAGVYFLPPSDVTRPSPRRMLRPVVMLTRLNWLRGPEHQEGRRLGETGPYLGELFLPPGRYRIRADWNVHQHGATDITLKEDDSVVEVRVVLQSRR